MASVHHRVGCVRIELADVGVGGRTVLIRGARSLLMPLEPTFPNPIGLPSLDGVSRLIALRQEGSHEAPVERGVMTDLTLQRLLRDSRWWGAHRHERGSSGKRGGEEE